MKTLHHLCVPRASVFDKSRRDVVLDITDLAENKIDPDDFFAENYLTDGMKRLLENAFLRFERKPQRFEPRAGRDEYGGDLPCSPKTPF